MGLILCDTHGETGFLPHVSKELSDKINRKERISKDEVKFVDIIIHDDESDEVVFSMRYWMSKECFDSLSASIEYKIVTEQDEEKVDNILGAVMKGGGCCGKCFEEYMEVIGLFEQLERENSNAYGSCTK